MFQDRFEIISEISRGTLASIYKVYDGETGDEVALKVLHAHLCREPLVVRRFRREVKIAKRLEHPGIVSPMELVQERESIALVLPLVDGDHLGLLRKGSETNSDPC